MSSPDDGALIFVALKAKRRCLRIQRTALSISSTILEYLHMRLNDIRLYT